MGRGIIISLLGPVGGLNELIHINTSCPWHILKTDKVLIMMIVMMTILECLLCARLYSHCLVPDSQIPEDRKYIYIYMKESEC